MRETNCPACMGLGSSEWGECTTCDGTGIAPTPSVSPETPTPCQCAAPMSIGGTCLHCRKSVAASPVGAERESRAGAAATSGGEDHEQSTSSGSEASNSGQALRAALAIADTALRRLASPSKPHGETRREYAERALHEMRAALASASPEPTTEPTDA